MKITQTDTEVTIVFDKDSYEYKYGFLSLIDMANIANAEMYNLANEFKSLIKNADPKEIMAKRWDDLFIEYTGACLDQMVANSSELASLVSDFYNQIGEAMGPVSYAGFKLRQYLNNDKTYQDWVDECIKVYSESDFAK